MSFKRSVYNLLARTINLQIFKLLVQLENYSINTKINTTTPKVKLRFQGCVVIK